MIILPLILFFIFCGLNLNAAVIIEEAELSIFSAAGAKPAMDEVCHKFEFQYGSKVKINYAGGGEAISQMMLSKSGDLYITPEQKIMESATEKQVIDPQTMRILAYVIPVIAVKKGNPKNITTLAGLAKPGIRVAIAWPETTLTGKYALEIFQKAGLAKEIEKNITTQTARPDQLLTMLILDQVDSGIIWHSYQTQAPDKIEIIYLPPRQITGVGKMQIAISAFSKDRESAQTFIDFATSAQGKAIFQKHGYMVDVEEVKKYYPEL
jgi:molybdate transport system substrate-binding protein